MGATIREKGDLLNVKKEDGEWIRDEAWKRRIKIVDMVHELVEIGKREKKDAEENSSVA